MQHRFGHCSPCGALQDAFMSAIHLLKGLQLLLAEHLLPGPMTAADSAALHMQLPDHEEDSCL